MSANEEDARAERFREAGRWLAVALEDIRIVDACLGLEEPAFSGAAYHCQQAAEKILKGFLVAANIPFRKTHEMDELADLVSVAYPDEKSFFDGTRSLTTWCVAYRYPSLEEWAEPLPDMSELHVVLKNIKVLSDKLQVINK
jgi:HEPN domain-containing protein